MGLNFEYDEEDLEQNYIKQKIKKTDNEFIVPERFITDCVYPGYDEYFYDTHHEFCKNEKNRKRLSIKQLIMLFYFSPKKRSIYH